MDKSTIKPRILIVEDEPIIAYDTQHILEGLNYEVVGIIDSGEEAIRQAGNLRPNLILMDIVLQGPIDGIQAAFIIRKSFNIPIIYMTANADDETIRRGRETEPYGYLLKPVNIRDIYSNIDSALHRHRMESQLRESEERFRRLVELSPDGIYIHVDGKIVYANRAGTINAGAADPAELIGKPVIEFLVPELRDIVLQRMAAVLGRGEQVPFMEETFVRLDGRQVSVEVAAVPMVFEGKPAIQVIARDLTERKRMEKALYESETRLRLIYENSRDAIGVSLDGIHVMTNPAYNAMFGYESGDQLVGVSIIELIAPEERERIRNYVRLRSQQEPLPTTYETRGQRRDGTTFDMEVRVSTYELNARLYTLVLIRNITERLAMERALRGSEARFRAMFERSHDAIVVFKDGRHYMANPAHQAMFGYASTEEFLGMSAEDLLAESSRAMVRGFIEKRMRGEEAPHSYEARCRRVDGTEFEVDVRATSYELDGERFTVGFLRDITERKRAAEALRQSEEKFMKAFETSPFLMAISTIEDGHLVEVNHSFLETLGYTRDEVIGKSTLALGLFVEPASRDAVIEQLKTRGRARDIDILVRSRTGEIRNGSLSAVSIEIGNRPYLLTVMNDITERVRAQAALERERNQFLAGPVVAFKWTAAPGWPLEYVSPNVSQYGYQAEDFTSGTRSFLSIIHPDDRERVIEEVRRYREGFVPSYEQEYRIFDRDGETRWVRNYTVVTRSEDGRVSHYDGYLLDITTRKRAEEDKARLEEQLTHAQKMESIGRLAGGIAHDFNNMLTAIIGNISLALMGVENEAPIYKTLNDALMAADSATALTRQLLAFSRKQIIEPRVIRLNDLIENMHRMLVRLIGENISLKTIVAPNLSTVKADPLQIEQIIVNLAVNARDAMNDGGTLIIETANHTVSEDFCRSRTDCRAGEYVVIAMTDTGTGMADDVRQHLFEPFFTTKPRGKGTGLGLAMIYGAVSQNGGFIDVETEPGHGTTFRIYLPASDEAPRAEPAPAQSGELPRGTETILLVEDEPAVRELAVKVLTRLGYRVIPCANGDEALTCVREKGGRIQMLITDVVMPGLNGRELALQVRTLLPAIRVLLSSGYVENIIAEGMLDRDGFWFIPKPYTPRELAHIVRMILDR